MRLNYFVSTLIFIFLFSSGAVSSSEQERQPTTVIIDASAFFDHLPRETAIIDGGSREISWLFNNTALELRVRTGMRGSVNVQTKVNIPEPGTYYLFVRSGGRSGSSFKVVVGEKMTSPIVCDAAMSFKATGSFDLQKGPVLVWITRMENSPVVDVLVLTKNKDFKEEDLPALQFPDDVRLLKEYQVAGGIVKFGDITGDGKSDFVVITANYSAHAYDHDGKELWSYQTPPERPQRIGFEAPGLIWDLDQDQRAEVIHWRYMDGKEWLVVADGMTGTIKKKVEWPSLSSRHVYNNFRLAVAKFHPGYPNDIVVFTDPGNTKSITAYNADLEQLWQYNEKRLKDHLGHYAYPVDLNNDGLDEVVASPLVLDGSGKLLWDRFDMFDDNHDHSDSFRFIDLNRDGQLEILSSFTDIGVMAFDALKGNVLWQHVAEHAQQIDVGHFLDAVPGPHIAVGARYYGNRNAGQAGLAGQVHWFDNQGNLLMKWPAHPIGGNPDFAKGDWMGNETEVLFWHKFRMTRDGRGVLYFPDPVYHMFDFNGDGVDEVITRGQGVIRVYGSKNANKKTVRRDPDYLRAKVTNHTHY